MASGENDWREDHYPESRFGGFTDVDGTLAFYLRVRSLVRPDSVVVDLGCGRGAWLDDPVSVRRDARWMKGKCASVIGLDISEAGRDNPSLDEFRALSGDRWPLEDGTVDIVFADHVLEHVAQPDGFFAECRRVLKPGGHLCLRTPNRWSYIAVAARLIPNARHAGILARVQQGRSEQDVFPTLYRCNTAPRLRRMLRRFGFTGVVRARESEPSYLAFSHLIYRLGVLHQKLAPAAVRSSLQVFARKD